MEIEISVEKANLWHLNITMKEKYLTKSEIIEYLNTLINQLQSAIDNVHTERNSETIVSRSGKGKNLLYIKDSSGNITYINKSLAERIPKLAQNRYNNEFVDAAKREIKQLKKSIKVLTDENHGTSDIDDVFKNFPEVLKSYITPNPLSSEDYARRWQQSNAIVKHRNIHNKDDIHKFKTIRGDYVCSKSEVMIADRLLANGIPYHYEVAFIPETEVDKSSPIYGEFGDIVGYETPGFDPFDDDTLHPDFYVLNKRTGKAYFWEHLGKLNDQKYCHKNLNRLIRMLDAGYAIGEDILITHEDDSNPLKTESIDEIIKKHLK